MDDRSVELGSKSQLRMLGIVALELIVEFDNLRKSRMLGEFLKVFACDEIIEKP
jgi:hypothetical protein